jgi:hypothetical protein
LSNCKIVKSTDVVAAAENYEKVRGRRRRGGRRRRRRRRRFVVPRPGTTLSHLVKMFGFIVHVPNNGHKLIEQYV